MQHCVRVDLFCFTSTLVIAILGRVQSTQIVTCARVRAAIREGQTKSDVGTWQPLNGSSRRSVQPQFDTDEVLVGVPASVDKVSFIGLVAVFNHDEGMVPFGETYNLKVDGNDVENAQRIVHCHAIQYCVDMQQCLFMAGLPGDLVVYHCMDGHDPVDSHTSFCGGVVRSPQEHNSPKLFSQ